MSSIQNFDEVSAFTRKMAKTKKPVILSIGLAAKKIFLAVKTLEPMEQ